MAQKAIVTAAIAAALGAGALHLYLARFEAEATGGASQPVVMVARDLSLGEVITEGALALHELPEQYVEERHIAGSDLARIIGTRATAAVRSGASLLWSDLDVMQAGRTLSSLVRTGMRAFSLPDGAASFDGLLRPGDRVDVLFTARTDEAAVATRTLLQNVLVLTVGADLGTTEKEASERRRNSSGVTLSVTPAQAEELASREGRGRLRLSLRNPEDLVTDLPPRPLTETPTDSTARLNLEPGRAR